MGGNGGGQAVGGDNEGRPVGRWDWPASDRSWVWQHCTVHGAWGMGKHATGRHGEVWYGEA